jgi:hypothetical protein
MVLHQGTRRERLRSFISKTRISLAIWLASIRKKKDPPPPKRGNRPLL